MELLCARLVLTLILVAYTSARIAANIDIIYIYPSDRKGVLTSLYPADWVAVADFVSRPLLTGLGLCCFLWRKERFSTKSQLHVCSASTVAVLASFLCDEWVFIFVLREHLWIWNEFLFDFVQILSITMQIYMTNLKLNALGWHRVTSWFSICTVLAVFYIACSSLALRWETLCSSDLCPYYNVCGTGFCDLRKAPALVFFLDSSGKWFYMLYFLPVVCPQVACMFYSAAAAESRQPDLRCIVYCLYINCMLLVAGILSTAFVSYVIRKLGHFRLQTLAIVVLKSPCMFSPGPQAISIKLLAAKVSCRSGARA